VNSCVDPLWIPVGFRATVFRDTIFAAGRAQAANDAGLCFGSDLILGFAVAGL